MKTRTLWLDILKASVEIKSTETHKSAARAFARPVNAFSEVLTQQTDKTDRSSSNHEGPLARAALLELFRKEREWESFFRAFSESSTYRLTTQTWQFRDELKDRGHRFQIEEVEDALLGLARELLPDSAAAGWNEDWAHELCKDTLTRLANHYARFSEPEIVGLSAQETWEERMCFAGQSNHPAAFRTALKGWEQAGLDAIAWARAKGGAA